MAAVRTVFSFTVPGKVDCILMRVSQDNSPTSSQRNREQGEKYTRMLRKSYLSTNLIRKIPITKIRTYGIQVKILFYHSRGI
jgi:hypothetical protein